MTKTAEAQNVTPRLIYYPEVKKLTGLSRSTIWKMERSGQFPRRRLVTTARVGWLETEVRSWIESRAEVEGGAVQPRCNLHRNQPATRRPSWLDRDDG